MGDQATGRIVVQHMRGDRYGAECARETLSRRRHARTDDDTAELGVRVSVFSTHVTYGGDTDVIRNRPELSALSQCCELLRSPRVHVIAEICEVERMRRR